MIYYLFDFLLNNKYLNATTILINIDNYGKKTWLLILFIDIFINKVPFIFFILICLKYINIFLKKGLVSSLLVNNIIYIIDYFIFSLILLILNKNFYLEVFLRNFIFNYILFWMLKREKFKGNLLDKVNNYQ